MRGETVWGFWQCNRCGRENSGKDTHCYSCGHPRDKNIRPYPESRGDGKPGPVVGSDYVYKGPDWHCPNCDAMNPASRVTCKNCGHTREKDDKDYFDLYPERKGVVLRSEDFREDTEEPSPHEAPSSDEEHHTSGNDVGYIARRAVSNFIDGGSRHSGPGFSLNVSAILKAFGIAAAVILAVILVIVIFAPKDRDLTVLSKSWVRTVRVEEYRTVSETDWYVPEGGRVTSTYQDIHHYDRVIDHYETVTKTRTVSVGGHYEFSGYIDNGDGSFTKDYNWVTDYDVETYTEQEPVYRREPVYRTKYVYDIEKWVFHHNEVTRGGNTEPYYAEVIPEDDQRIGGFWEECYIVASYMSGDEEKKDTYTISREEWNTLEIGQIIHGRIHFGNNVELIFDDQ